MPTYTNADLTPAARRARLGLGDQNVTDIYKSPEEQAAIMSKVYGPGVEKLLGQAHDTLDSANSLSDEINNTAAYDTQRMNEVDNNPYPLAGSVMEPTTEKAMRLAKQYGVPALDALSALGLVTGVGTVPATAWMAGRSAQDLATRKDVGANMGTAMDVAGLLPALGPLARMGKTAGAAEDLIRPTNSALRKIFGVRAAEEVPYAGTQSAQAIKDVIAGAEPSVAVRAEAGIPKGGFMKKGGYESQKALEGLKGSMNKYRDMGPWNAPPTYANPTQAIESRLSSPSATIGYDTKFQWPSDMDRNQQIFRRMSNEGTFGNASQDWSQALTAKDKALADAMRALDEVNVPMPPSENSMSPLERLRSRAQERYGRSYRME